MGIWDGLKKLFGVVSEEEQINEKRPTAKEALMAELKGTVSEAELIARIKYGDGHGLFAGNRGDKLREIEEGYLKNYEAAVVGGETGIAQPEGVGRRNLSEHLEGIDPDKVSTTQTTSEREKVAGEIEREIN